MSDGFPGMTDDTRSRIKETWNRFSEKQEDMYELGIPMFEKLFELKPETKKLFHFDESNPERWAKVKAHVKLLFDTMGFSISMIDDQASVTPIIVDLGTRHFYYGVNQNFYLVFGECLVHAITKALGESFTEEDKTAFMTFYHWIGGCIVKGMSMESLRK
ncbi:neuroglobin-like [Mytilus californianus]|uniref:neuroglobin-like n=1 Tax=Mytilus californianus TaxID=6549 RepID=UPI0022464A5C|nr:neuroglobin-like [Mytilus californianus]XP_052094965.1 neuroglobin-like [Mytilus californianus]XP_052094966.1 neuroglobin-like [Mytilus californianus]XP_052094967.1 neuroglobin-like [Mytilus californianus]XP_052094968.1 neuroglobin-like [Mytilus californianus]XP_052094969.1 neuroglobin-like [Mytilus californianus]